VFVLVVDNFLIRLGSCFKIVGSPGCRVGENGCVKIGHIVVIRYRFFPKGAADVVVIAKF
jgi:hypothetical protein